MDAKSPDTKFSLICHHFLTLYRSDLKSEHALRNVAEHCGENADEGVGYGGVQRIDKGKEPHQAITDEYKGNGGEAIPEKLYAPMQVRLRENDVARHDEAGRKTETKGNNIGGYLGCNIEVAINVNGLLVENKIDGNELDQYVEHSIGAATGKVTKRTRRYDPGKWLVEEVNRPYNDMSERTKQFVKIDCKGKLFS